MFVLEEATLVLLRNMFKSRGSRCNFSFSFSFSFFNDLCIKGSGRWIESEGEEMDDTNWIFPWPQLLLNRGVKTSVQVSKGVCYVRNIWRNLLKKLKITLWLINIIKLQVNLLRVDEKISRVWMENLVYGKLYFYQYMIDEEIEICIFSRFYNDFFIFLRTAWKIR